ncbi:MAG TPA: hypothetical protein VIL28_04160 [Steroidobacteraceae bacterium]
MKPLSILILTALFAGCTTAPARIDAIAARAGLTREIVEGTQFRHLVYTQPAHNEHSRWTVYLEGDGRPWISGRVPADDPTSREPYALELMLRADGPALYVTRPCYHALRDAACATELWTSARYSEEVVASMAAAIERKLSALGASGARLVGYSGGGTLAVLIAERLQRVAEVVTIAANLDIERWAAHHGYLPLYESLNPARSQASHPWNELHLQGSKDEIVPPVTTNAYFERFPNARQLTFADYDHICCWVRDWSRILAEIDR